MWVGIYVCSAKYIYIYIYVCAHNIRFLVSAVSVKVVIELVKVTLCHYMPLVIPGN
jgi:hypothetical protein